MNPAATNVYDDSTMIVTIPMSSHTPTGIAVDIGLPEKKGGGGALEVAVCVDRTA
jgi:hypothetical protein